MYQWEMLKVHQLRKRLDSVDSELMLTIDDSGANNDHEEREITDPTIASELRILELAEQLEERLFVAFLHSKVTIVCSIHYVCDCKLFIKELNKVYLWLEG